MMFLTLLPATSQVHQTWVARYNGPGNAIDIGVSAHVDGNGYVSTVSSSNGGTPTGLDICVIKYDGSGNQLWVARYEGPGASNDIPRESLLDAAGNSYVTGGTSTDSATLKFN
jgi:hypothetical protein